MIVEAFSRLLERRAIKINPIHPQDPALFDLFNLGRNTIAGIDVSEDNALNFSAVFAAVRCIAETVAVLPLHVYRRRAQDRDREDAHPASVVLRRPNPNMTRMVFRETAMKHLLLWGNSYVEVERNRLGQAVSLWPRHPARVRVKRRPDGRLWYLVDSADGARAPVEIDGADMLHVPCMGNGEVGQSVVSWARDSIAAGLAAERFGGAFFANGAKPGGILKLSRPTTRERKQEIARQWEEKFSGAANVARLAVLDHDSDYQHLGIPPEDAQFLETRLFQVQEVSRWFRISPTKLMDFSHGTFSNIEEINRQFAGETIHPWAERWEQEYERKLLRDDEQEELFIEHDLAGLLEGDMETQATIFSNGRQWGWYTINEIRRKLNMNGVGPEGDKHLSPGNMVDAAQLASDQDSDSDSDADAEPAQDATDEPLPEETQKAELLGTVGGMTGAVQVLTAVGQGVITTDTAVELFKLFFAIDEEQAKAIVGDGPPEDQREDNDEDEDQKEDEKENGKKPTDEEIIRSRLSARYTAKAQSEIRHNSGAKLQRALGKLHDRFVSDLRVFELDESFAKEWLATMEQGTKHGKDT